MVRKLRILVVDDEPDAVSMLSVLLEDEGYEAISGRYKKEPDKMLTELIRAPSPNS